MAVGMFEDDIDLTDVEMGEVDHDEAEAFDQFALDQEAAEEAARRAVQETDEPSEAPQATGDSSATTDMITLMYGPQVRSWQVKGNCMGVDPDLFFPERGASTREAKEVCRGCVVREDCLEYAIVNGEKFGIWGGLSERERRRLRRQRSMQRRGISSSTMPSPVPTKEVTQSPTPLKFEHLEALPGDAKLRLRVRALLEDYGGVIEHSGGRVTQIIRTGLGLSTDYQGQALSSCLSAMSKAGEITRVHNAAYTYKLRLVRKPPPQSVAVTKMPLGYPAEMPAQVIAILEAHGGSIELASGRADTRLRSAMKLTGAAKQEQLRRCLADMERQCQIVVDRRAAQVYSITLTKVRKRAIGAPPAPLPPTPTQLNQVRHKVDPELTRLVLEFLQEQSGYVQDPSGFTASIVAEGIGKTTPFDRRKLAIALDVMEKAGQIERDMTSNRTRSISLPGVDVPGAVSPTPLNSEPVPPVEVAAAPVEPETAPKPGRRPSERTQASRRADAAISEGVIKLLQDRGGVIRDDSGSATTIIVDALNLTTLTARNRLTKLLARMGDEGLITVHRSKTRIHAIALPQVSLEAPIPPVEDLAPKRRHTQLPSEAELRRCVIKVLTDRGGYIKDTSGGATTVILAALSLSSKPARLKLNHCLTAMESEGLIVRDRSETRTYSISLSDVTVPATVVFDPANPKKSLIEYLRTVENGQIINNRGTLLSELYETLGVKTEQDKAALRAAINHGVAYLTFGRAGTASKPILLRLNSRLMEPAPT